MERYHIFKLGLAILFYAAYCIRPMVANNQTQKYPDNDYVFYDGVQGKPGVDFPVYSHIPRTSFNCRDVESGYYADLETDCQVFHICEDNKKISFLCPNGTIFQQAELICEWWFKVNCTNAPNLYEESAEQLREENARRKASRRVKNHGAVMRTEEKSSVSAVRKTIYREEQSNDLVRAPTSDVRDRNEKTRSRSRNEQTNPTSDSRIRSKNEQVAKKGNNVRGRKPVQFQKQGVDVEEKEKKRTRKPEKPRKEDSYNNPTTYQSTQTPKFQIKFETFQEQFDQTTLSPTSSTRNNINDSDEAQITQETASIYSNNFNKIQTPNPYPNHRETYSDLKEPRYYSTKIYSAISSVTPHYLTTQPLNNGRPFLGSQVGTTLRSFSSTAATTQITTPKPFDLLPTDLFNVGKTDTVPPRNETVSTPDYATVYGKFPTPSKNQGRRIISLSKSVFAGTTPRSTNSAEILTASDSIHGAGNPQVRFFGKVETTSKVPKVLFRNNGNSFSITNFKGTKAPKSSTTFVSTPKPQVSTAKEFVSTTREFVSTTQTPISTTISPFAHFESTKLSPVPTTSGFYVTKMTEVLRPRPFQLPPEPSFTPKPVFSTPLPTYPTYKISSASPFAQPSTPEPTLPTPFTTSTIPSTFENVDNMINTLAEMAKKNFSERPGLLVPPSVGPQTLHSLAVYFANAMDGKKNEEPEEKKKLTELLTQMTMDRFNELFNESKSEEILEAQNSKAPVETPKVRQLAKIFTQALSSYLDDPVRFRKVLEEVRPTEPPAPEEETTDLDELLNFSDADSKSNFPFYPPSPRPTWGYLIASNGIKEEKENLQGADSQSFVSQLNKLHKEATTKSSVQLPDGHWTSSPDANTLFKKAFSFNPASINEDFETTEANIASTEQVPHHEIQYELKALPQLDLNQTQVHGILIDFMNTTKLDENSRLQRILRKLNTTQDEFLEKMKEIEQNPLTRRLILLLISECGSKGDVVPVSSLLKDVEPKRQNSGLDIVDASLGEDSQDARALQLLNSLYTIASRFGK